MHSVPVQRTSAIDAFEAQRAYLQGVAYRMLGSWSEAEDIVQEAWIRWTQADIESVETPRAFLSRTVTRLCLDLLKSARVRREQYVGTWLPEPVLDDHYRPAPTPTELAQDLSIALMLTLERLSPAERAAFILRDVFDLPFSEVALALDRNEAACRQLAARARQRVRDERPRYEASEQEGMRIAQAFLYASRDGNIDALRQLLAQDAVLHSDGGGKKLAVPKPLLGSERIARFFAGIAAKTGGQVSRGMITKLNGMPGILATEPDGLPRTTALELVDGKIRAIYVVRNPDKLRHMPAVE